MIIIKSQEEIAILREGGNILAEALQETAKIMDIGISVFELNKIAEDVVSSYGAICAFKGYRPRKISSAFPTALCVSINDAVVHGLGNSDRVLCNGDLVSIDLGVEYKGLFTDAAITVAVGEITEKDKNLLKVTKEALLLGIEQVKAGNYIHDISKAVQKHVEAHGFGVVRDLVGHGVGKSIHEDPAVPNFYAKHFPIVKLKEGMVIAIEPMVTSGDYSVKTLDDGWTVSTRDGSNSVHFEHSVAVIKDGYQILTKI